MRPLALLRLMRPKQWSKNLLVFAALIFTGEYTRTDSFIAASLAFVAFCLVSSATYAFNDVRDADEDRAHPKKSPRPVASGHVSAAAALAFGAVLLLAGVGIALVVDRGLLWSVLLYLVVQALYNFGLRRVAVADAFTIAAGFVIRAVAGALAIDRGISGWLLLCTGALALLVAFGKRRAELVANGESSARQSLLAYGRESLNALTVVAAALSCLCYGLYAIESDTARTHPALILTAPFVWFGVLRYLALAIGRDAGEEPETMLFRDPGILLALVGFVGLAIFAMSGATIPGLEVEPR